MALAFETCDVLTDTRFGGNPLLRARLARDAAGAITGAVGGGVVRKARGVDVPMARGLIEAG